MAELVMVPVSVGELADKLSILAIKLQRIKDSAKLANVRTEMETLIPIWKQLLDKVEVAKIAGFLTALRQINMRLWDLEDRVRVARTNPELAHCAVDIFTANDERADVKRRINAALGSLIVEEKSYETR
jgi:hypothetical protein